MTTRKLPNPDTLLWLRRTCTLKEIAAMYGVWPSTVHDAIDRAESLMRETKRLAWAAWEAKQGKVKTKG